MSAVDTLQVAGDLLVQADKIRAHDATVAEALETDVFKLLTQVPSLSVAQVAELLGQSRPTIYEWIKAGYLLTQEAGANGVSISPESLLAIIPILHEWEEQGREGRPSRLLREWFAGALDRHQQRLAFAERRRAGLTGLRPPRRGQAAALAGVR